MVSLKASLRSRQIWPATWAICTVYFWAHLNSIKSISMLIRFISGSVGKQHFLRWNFQCSLSYLLLTSLIDLFFKVCFSHNFIMKNNILSRFSAASFALNLHRATLDVKSKNRINQKPFIFPCVSRFSKV